MNNEKQLEKLPEYKYVDIKEDYDEEYIPISRIVFCIDDTRSSSDFPIYKRGCSVNAYCISKRESCSPAVCEQDSVMIPTMKIAANPIWINDEIDQYGESIIDSTIKRGIAAINRQIDTETFKVIHAAVTPDHVIHASNTYENNPIELLSYIVSGISCITSHELLPAYIIMHPNIYGLLSLVEHKHLYLINHVASLEKTYSPGTYIGGYWRGIPVLVNSMIPKNLIHITASPYHAGYYIVKQEPTAGEVIYNASKFRKECFITADVGFGVLENYAISEIILDSVNKLPSVYKKVECATPVVESISFWKTLINKFKK